jgi:hypothetical protein
MISAMRCAKQTGGEPFLQQAQWPPLQQKYVVYLNFSQLLTYHISRRYEVSYHGE